MTLSPSPKTWKPTWRYIPSLSTFTFAGLMNTASAWRSRQVYLLLYWVILNSFQRLRIHGWNHSMLLLQQSIKRLWPRYSNEAVRKFLQLWSQRKMSYILLRSHYFLRRFPPLEGPWGYTLLVLARLRSYDSYLLPLPPCYGVALNLLEQSPFFSLVTGEFSLTSAEDIMYFRLQQLLQARMDLVNRQHRQNLDFMYEQMQRFAGGSKPFSADEESLWEWHREYFFRKHLEGFSPNFDANLCGLAYYLTYLQRKPASLPKNYLEDLCRQMEIYEDAQIFVIMETLHSILFELQSFWSKEKLPWPPKDPSVFPLPVLGPYTLPQFRWVLETFLSQSKGKPYGGLHRELMASPCLPGGRTWQQVLEDLGPKKKT